jgi:two-component system LytT family response regulator
MMRCLAIDDEPLALAQLTAYIARTPFLQLSAACPSALEAVRILMEKEADLLFVDINMPDMNGLDFVRALQHKPLVIFTTAYAEYALDGFRVDALDYLLKPIGYPDFVRSAEKALRQFKLLSGTQAATPANEPESLFVKSGYKMMQIDIPAITHIESRSEYLRIYTLNTPPVMTLGSLKSIEEKLPAGRFMRIHRSYIVNLQKIISIQRSYIMLQGDIRVSVGEQYREVFRTYLSKHLL